MSFEYNVHGLKINSYDFPWNFYTWLPWAFEYSMGFYVTFHGISVTSTLIKVENILKSRIQYIIF